MATLNLVNVDIERSGGERTFEVEGYCFVQYKSIPQDAIKKNKRYYQNGHVEFSGSQHDSILKRDLEGNVGLRGNRSNPQKQKRLDDVLLLCSLFTGRNWNRYANRSSRAFPVCPYNFCENLFHYSETQGISSLINTAIKEISKSKWQTQFENGFHLGMLYNHSNIMNLESRFISYIVIWEWLYPHLKHPNGATIENESGNLDEIIRYILKESFDKRVNFESNFYLKLRHQLAHSGGLPINKDRCKRVCKKDKKNDEKYYEKNKWISERSLDDIQFEYIPFFEKLTQVVVLKTLGIDAEYILPNFRLEKYLNTGDPFDN